MPERSIKYNESTGKFYWSRDSQKREFDSEQDAINAAKDYYINNKKAAKIRSKERIRESMRRRKSNPKPKQQFQPKTSSYRGLVRRMY